MQAPIILFVYNRPYHTRQTVEALQKNVLAKESELFIYSDAPKNSEAKQSVQEVREYIKSIAGFKKVTIIEREKNWGLAANIIDGVTKIVNKYGKVIVLEDDLVTSPYFLKFMNDALVFYQEEKRVWHISGWNYPIDPSGLPDTFMWQVMNCWGWATWTDRWQHFEKDPDKLIASSSSSDIRRFNLDGVEDFWSQVLSNKEGIINTWAIFWYATIFQRRGLCLNATQSYVQNIGLDGSGIHCGVEKDFSTFALNLKDEINFSTKICEDPRVVKEVKKYLRRKKGSLMVRILKRIMHYTITKRR